MIQLNIFIMSQLMTLSMIIMTSTGMEYEGDLS